MLECTYEILDREAVEEYTKYCSWSTVARTVRLYEIDTGLMNSCARRLGPRIWKAEEGSSSNAPQRPEIADVVKQAVLVSYEPPLDG